LFKQEDKYFLNMKSISNFYKILIIIFLTLIISRSFPSMFAKGGMDMKFYYFNFLFVLIVGMILIYDFYKINFLKKILFLFTVSLFTFISGIYLVQEILKIVYDYDYELHIRFNDDVFNANIIFYSILVCIELLSFQIIKRFYK
jgi:hypothetical protein